MSNNVLNIGDLYIFTYQNAFTFLYPNDGAWVNDQEAKLLHLSMIDKTSLMLLLSDYYYLRYAKETNEPVIKYKDYEIAKSFLSEDQKRNKNFCDVLTVKVLVDNKVGYVAYNKLKNLRAV